MIKRVIFDIALFLSVIISPWWISILLLVVGVLIFAKFYEFIVAGVIIYSLYAVPGVMWISSPAIFAIILVIVFFVAQYIRDNVFLYKK